MSATSEPVFYVLGSIFTLINNEMQNGGTPPFSIGMSPNVRAIYDSEIEQVKHDKQIMYAMGFVDVVEDAELDDESVYLLENN